jgi:hypothetical protein
MKINLKYFIVLSIFCFFPFTAYSQKRNNTLLKDTNVADVELKLDNDDSRPPFILEDVKGKNVSDFGITNCGNLPDKKIDKAGDIKL